MAPMVGRHRRTHAPASARRWHSVGQRHQLVADFAARMVPAGVDRFAAAGMAATWWEESFYELETAANRGWKAVIEAWLTTTEASQDDKKAPNLADQAVIKLLAGPQLAERTVLADEHARLDAFIKAADASDEHASIAAEIKKLKSARTKAKKQSQSHRRFTAPHSPSDPRRHATRRRPHPSHRCTPQPDRETRNRPHRHHRTHHPRLVRQPRRTNTAPTSANSKPNETPPPPASPAPQGAGIWLIGGEPFAEVFDLQTYWIDAAHPCSGRGSSKRFSTLLRGKRAAGLDRPSAD